MLNLQTPVKRLEHLLAQNPLVQEVLRLAPSLKMPNWYLGSGAITQTVWNVAHGFESTFGIKDLDVVYFDDRDLSYEAEDDVIQRGMRLFAHLPIEVEIRNQARVHLWYEKKFGLPIQAFHSTEESIRTWPTTATSIGVRRDDPSDLIVFAPFGLEDLFELIVRPNKAQITEVIYRAKVDRWSRLWPKLRILPWNA